MLIRSCSDTCLLIVTCRPAFINVMLALLFTTYCIFLCIPPFVLLQSVSLVNQSHSHT